MWIYIARLRRANALVSLILREEMSLQRLRAGLTVKGVRTQRL